MTSNSLLFAALLSSTAAAQTTDTQTNAEDYEQRIAALEEQTAELRKYIDSEHTTTVEQFERIEALIGATTQSGQVGAPISGFRVGDTTLRIGGYVDFDAHSTYYADGPLPGDSAARDFYIPGATPIGADSKFATDLTAQSSRFSVTATREFNGKMATAYLETDFLLTEQGDERVSSSFSERLRRAFVDYNGWRIGQEWSTFQDLSAIPESASFLVLSDGMAFDRQALVRYTNGPWQFALENPSTTITNNAAGGGARITADASYIPDVVARYNFTGDHGQVSLSGIGRQLRAESTTVTGSSQIIDDDAFGYGVALQGRVKVGDKDDIRFNLMGGEGLGRYAGLNTANAVAVDDAGMRFDTIGSYGGFLAWRHPFAETARFNIGYSTLFVDNPSFVPGNANDHVQSAYAAILWDVASRVTAGFEVLHGQREVVSGESGNLTRFTFSLQCSF